MKSPVFQPRSFQKTFQKSRISRGKHQCSGQDVARDAASPVTVPASECWLYFCSSFLHMHLGTRQRWLQHLDPSHPWAGPGLNSRLLALAWPCPNLSGHLGSEPADGTPLLK